MNVSSTDFTEYSSFFNGKEPMIDKENAWSMPFVSGRIYNAWWLTGLDFTHLAIDISQRF